MTPNDHELTDNVQDVLEGEMEFSDVTVTRLDEHTIRLSYPRGAEFLVQVTQLEDDHV